MKTTLSIILAGIFCIMTNSAYAGWVDDWISQHSGSSPSYIQGQERGYYSGGNFSMRWQNQNTYPITTTLPHVKSGCGGIDVFMGGFSFMDTDHLVNKLQAILTNAAGVAFDLALKTTCEMCSNTIKNLEALSDTLNNLQMNECSAGKSLVATVVDNAGWKMKSAQRAELGEAINYDKLSSGVSDLWSKLTTDQRAANNVPSTADTQSVTSGCNSTITSIFLQDGLLLTNLGNQMGLPTPYTDLMRGLVGDVRLEIKANHNVSYVPPCPQNNQNDLGAVTAGLVYAKNASGTCSQVPDSNADLVTYTTTVLTGVLQKIQNKQSLSADETTFVDSSPLATIPILKLAVVTDTADQTIGNLADLTAKAYALQILSDLYTRATSITMKAREILARQNGAATGQPDSKCADATFAPDIDSNLAEMLKNIQTVRKAAQASYNTSAQQFAGTMQYLQQMQQQQIFVQNQVRKLFGDYAANSVKARSH